jgi:hypothetical protein
MFQFMRILNRKEIAKLDAQQVEEYQTALDEYVEKFISHFGGNTTEVTGRIRKVTAPNRFSDNGRVEVSFPAEARPLGGQFNLPRNVFDLFADNSGYLNGNHMAANLKKFLNKGEIVFSVELRVEGEEYETKDGEVKSYNKTHHNILPIEYVPSLAIAEFNQKVSAKAEEDAHRAIIFGTAQTAGPVSRPAANTSEAEMPQPQEEAEETDV